MDMYAENILDHSKSPHRFYKLPDYTVSSSKVNSFCGDKYDVFLKINSDFIITDCSFLGEGCAISKAGISMLMDDIIGQHIDEVSKFNKDYILNLLGIDVSAGRIKCALLGVQTVQDAIKKYKEEKIDQ